MNKEKADVLTFDDIVNHFKSPASEFPDKRTGTNLVYNMEDTVMGAFPVFFTQSPPFPAFYMSKPLERLVRLDFTFTQL